MKIDIATVDRLADLARLEFDNQTKEEMVKDMNNMLQFVDKISELDTAGVEPLIFLTEESNVFREDEISHEVSQAEALKNAPKKDMYYFRVPKVIQQ
jgi:aspartyl-tRNA(Asn)/glutamyl-tRNA(Gln) amidotransferase subunit C